jgi:hypothetical protein
MLLQFKLVALKEPTSQLLAERMQRMDVWEDVEELQHQLHQHQFVVHQHQHQNQFLNQLETAIVMLLQSNNADQVELSLQLNAE